MPGDGAVMKRAQVQCPRCEQTMHFSALARHKCAITAPSVRPSQAPRARLGAQSKTGAQHKVVTCSRCGRKFQSGRLAGHACKPQNVTPETVPRALVVRRKRKRGARGPQQVLAVAKKAGTRRKPTVDKPAESSSEWERCDLCGQPTSDLKRHWADYCRKIVQGGAPGLGKRR